MNVPVLGVGMHPFGRYPGKSEFLIGAEAAVAAVDDAELAWRDVEALYLGHAFSTQGAGHKVADLLGRRGIPIVNVENACSSGGAALQMAMRDVEHGRFDVVMALGLDKLPRGFMDSRFYEPWRKPAGQAVNPLMFAFQLRRYVDDHGVSDVQLAAVSVKNHEHGVHNRYAMYQKRLSVGAVLDSPMVVDPLRLLMLCAPNEGAAACIVGSETAAARQDAGHRRVSIRGSGLVTATAEHPLGEHMPVCSAVADEEPPSITRLAGQQAYEAAGIGPDDVDVAEVQDTDVGSELLGIEALGFCGEGEAAALTERGETRIGGRLPVNPSGGLLSKGEPVGASSLGQVAEIVWQLRGQAGARQVEGARTGLAQSLGAGGNACVIVLTA